MGEVVYGIDFRAGKEEAPLCNAPDVAMACEEALREHHGISPVMRGIPPSEYTAPDGDCA